MYIRQSTRILHKARRDVYNLRMLSTSDTQGYGCFNLPEVVVVPGQWQQRETYVLMSRRSVQVSECLARNPAPQRLHSHAPCG